MFGSMMTRGAKADKVGQFIGLQIMIVFIGIITEFTKRFDVVNIEFLAQFLLGYAAMLAGVAIAAAGQAALGGPVGAVVVDGSAFPVGAIFSYSILTLPLILTRGRAKSAAPLFRYARPHLKSCAALLAGGWYFFFPSRVILSSLIFALPLILANPGAKPAAAISYCARPYLEVFSTLLAMGCCSIPRRVTCPYPIFASPLPLTGSGAKFTKPLSYIAIASFKILAALLASSYRLTTLPILIFLSGDRLSITAPRAKLTAAPFSYARCHFKALVALLAYGCYPIALPRHKNAPHPLNWRFLLRKTQCRQGAHNNAITVANCQLSFPKQGNYITNRPFYRGGAIFL
jgi:hypothetical protein